MKIYTSNSVMNETSSYFKNFICCLPFIEGKISDLSEILLPDMTCLVSFQVKKKQEIYLGNLEGSALCDEFMNDYHLSLSSEGIDPLIRGWIYPSNNKILGLVFKIVDPLANFRSLH